MSISTLTRSQIATLADESAAQGDTSMVRVCRSAMGGSYRSRCAVVSAIRAMDAARRTA